MRASGFVCSQTTKELKGQIEAEISAQYNGRKVNLFGEISNI